MSKKRPRRSNTKFGHLPSSDKSTIRLFERSDVSVDKSLSKFHYTTASGLIGIVTTNTLWAIQLAVAALIVSGLLQDPRMSLASITGRRFLDCGKIYRRSFEETSKEIAVERRVVALQ